MKYLCSLLIFFLLISIDLSQIRICLGADLSNVNELEDCGVMYSENGIVKDIYQIVEENGLEKEKCIVYNQMQLADVQDRILKIEKSLNSIFKMSINSL